MAYLEYLAQDYERWKVTSANSAAGVQSFASHPHPSVVRALQAVLLEIEQAQVFVAVSASIATALLTKGGSGVGPWHIHTYGPAEPEVYSAAGGALNIGLDVQNLMPVITYYGRLGFAQRLSHGAVRLDPRLPGNQRRAEFEKLEDAWRHVCSASLEAGQSIRAWLDVEGQSLPPLSNGNAEMLLKSAGRGERPCVDSEGQVTVPGWAECRSSKRVAVQRPVLVRYRGGEQSVMIDNASTTGLGLRGLAGGVSGRLISVTLEDGDVLTGVIVWDRDGRTGVRLDNRIREDHIVLAGPMKN